MFHLYSGNGTVSDRLGTHRALVASAYISDQLTTQAGDPVIVTPGDPLAVAIYLYRIADWQISVDRIGTFVGARGSIAVQMLNATVLADVLWGFNSDVDGLYDWRGQVGSMQTPDWQQWPTPTAPDFAQLPRQLQCNGMSMGPAIASLFTAQPVVALDLSLTRV